MDVDRVTFLLKSYVRQRIFKIEKFAMHLKDDEHMRSRLTEDELRYWARYISLWEEHVHSEVLHDLPPQYNQLDGNKRDYDVDMIVRPSRSEHVFFKAAEDVGSLKIGEEETEV